MLNQRVWRSVSRNAQITFDKFDAFHVAWHASTPVDNMQRILQRSHPV